MSPKRLCGYSKCGETRVGGKSVLPWKKWTRLQLEEADARANLAAMEQQVETLQRIVNLKDEQIAALQAALAESAGPAADATDAELAEELVAEKRLTDDRVTSAEEASLRRWPRK